MANFTVVDDSVPSPVIHFAKLTPAHWTAIIALSASLVGSAVADRISVSNRITVIENAIVTIKENIINQNNTLTVIKANERLIDTNTEHLKQLDNRFDRYDRRLDEVDRKFETILIEHKSKTKD